MKSLRSFYLILPLFCLVMWGATSALFSQATNGVLVGVVQDPSGAAIPGAEVIVLNQGSNQSFSAVSSDQGGFRIPNLEPGNYQVTVALTGFKTYVVRDVKINVGEEYSLTARLELGEVQETVTVAVGADLVNTTDAQISATIDKLMIEELPLADRNPMNLIRTMPGTAQNGNNPTSISGLRVSFTNITQDGVNIQDNFIRSNATTFTPNRLTQSMIGEFSIATQNQGVNSGFGASQVNMITPSGGNELHGEVYYYHRNSATAANDFFSNRVGEPKPQLIRHQFGAAASGPIIKDKLLWYANYEGFREYAATSKLNTILTESARQGIFTYNAADGSGLKEVNLLQLRGLSADPTVQGLLQRVPTQGNDLTRGDGLNTTGYRFNMQDSETRDQWGFRLDYILNQAHSFEGIYRGNDFWNDRPDIYNGFEYVPRNATLSTPDFLSTAWNWTVSPTLLNEVRFGFNLAGVVFEDNEDRSRGYKIAVNSFTNPEEDFERQGRDTDTWIIQDNASWSRGAHSFRFGFQGQNVRIFDFTGFTVYPEYGLGVNAANDLGFASGDFEGGISATDLATADDLLGDLGGVLDTADAEYNIRDRTSGFKPVESQWNWEYDIYAFYFGDAWRLGPRLTLNMGVRWEYYRQLRERDDLITQPVVTGDDAVRAVLDPNNVVDFVSGDLINDDLNNFAPNIGLAWDVFGDGKTALRAGYGIAYVNDEMQRAPGNAINRYGVAAGVSLNNLTGLLSQGLPSLPAPLFKMPLSWPEIYDSTSPYFADSLPAAFTVDPNLSIPYAQTWQLGVQREVGWNTAVEVRYVGTKGTKLVRAADYNQVIIRENGFLNDFLNAQNNATLAQAAGLGYDPRYNPDIAGSQPLPVFDQMVGGGLLTNRTVRTQIEQGRAGELINIYNTNGLCGNVQCVANPEVFVADVTGNGADSSYHALQVEARRRFQGGLMMGANYTFGKTLTNASGAGQTNFEPILDLANPGYDRGRASYDVTHVFNATFIWELPFGQGRRFNIENSVLNQIAGGWDVTSVFNYQSGTPFGILSNRGTLNRNGRSSGRNMANSDLDSDSIRNLIGVGSNEQGPYFINPATRTDGTFYHPAAGKLGTVPRFGFNGPNQFVWDLGIIKRFNVVEDVKLEFRAEFFNFTNHTNFNVGNETQSSTSLSLDSSNFGRLTTLTTDPRITQFSLKVLF